VTAFPNVFSSAACRFQQVKRIVVPWVEIDACRFGYERGMFVQDRRQSVGVALYQVAEQSRGIPDKFRVLDVEDEIHKVYGGQSTKGGLRRRRHRR